MSANIPLLIQPLNTDGETEPNSQELKGRDLRWTIGKQPWILFSFSWLIYWIILFIRLLLLWHCCVMNFSSRNGTAVYWFLSFVVVMLCWLYFLPWNYCVDLLWSWNYCVDFIFFHEIIVFFVAGLFRYETYVLTFRFCHITIVRYLLSWTFVLLLDFVMKLLCVGFIFGFFIWQIKLNHPVSMKNLNSMSLSV